MAIKKKIKVLYIFANTRKKMEEDWQNGKMPDTYFIGLNHLKEFGIKAHYIENKFINYIRGKNYNLANIILLTRIRKYDIVFCGASLLIIFLAKVILRFKKPKIVCYNINFTNLLKKNNKGIKRWILNKTIESMDAIVCPTKAQIKYLTERGFDKNKLYFNPTGVDIDFISSRLKKSDQHKPKEKYILSVGKDNGRDYATLIEAARDIDIKVRIVALPRNFIGIDLKKLPPNIDIQYWTPFSKLMELYRNAEFIVVSTKREDDLNASDCSGHYVMLDSMASGKAIIASERSTIHDYITNGHGGILVDPEDPAKLKHAIRQLLDNPRLAEKMGRRSYQKVNKLFTTKIFAKKLASIFVKLIEQKDGAYNDPQQ